MRWSVALAALALIAAASFGMYQLKYDVARLEQELEGLNRDLIAEGEAIRVLKAEWSYLNRPERLQNLVARYLELGPAVVHPLAGLDDLPLHSRQGAQLSVLAPSLPPLPSPKPSLLGSGADAAQLASARPAR